MSEWKPGAGDVALVRYRDSDGPAVVGICTTPNGNWRTTEHGSTSAVVPVRPLVVIDPEDAEQVGMLAALYDTVTHGEVTSRTPMNIRELRMQAALREFANPTPPDPAPTYTDAEARAMREAIRRIERGGGS